MCVLQNFCPWTERNAPPSPTSPGSSVCCQSFSFSFGPLYFLTVLWKIVWTAVTRRKPNISFAQDWKYNRCPSADWSTAGSGPVWAVKSRITSSPGFRRGFIPALKESLRFTWNQQTSSFSPSLRSEKVKWQRYGNVSILWKMIINSVIKIIGSCLNGFAHNCFCSRGLVMCICFVGLFVSSVSELSWSLSVWKQHVRPFKWGPKIRIRLRFWCCKSFRGQRPSDHDKMCSRGSRGTREIPVPSNPTYSCFYLNWNVQLLTL